MDFGFFENGLFGGVFHTLYLKSGHNGILDGFYRLFKLVVETQAVFLSGGGWEGREAFPNSGGSCL